MKKYFLIIGLLAVGLQSCKFGNDSFVRNDNVGGALGTSYSIISFTENKSDLQPEIDSVFAVINQSLSTYIPESDISRVNNGDSTVVVDAMFKEVLQLSQTIHKETNGFFDPTVGTLVNAWGFGPEQKITMDSLKVTTASLMNYGLSLTEISTLLQCIVAIMTIVYLGYKITAYQSLKKYKELSKNFEYLSKKQL